MAALPQDLPVVERDVVRLIVRDTLDRILLFHAHEITAPGTRPMVGTAGRRHVPGGPHRAGSAGAVSRRTIGCYLARGSRQECIRRGAGLYPDGWKDFILMAVLQSDYASAAGNAPAGGPDPA